MPKRPDYLRLADILKAGERITTRLATVSLEQFLSDESAQDTVLWNFMIIGEAAAHTTSELRVRYPAIAWRDASDFRNRVVHGYAEIDLRIVYDAAMIDIPQLIADVGAAFNKEFPSD